MPPQPSHHYSIENVLVDLDSSRQYARHRLEIAMLVAHESIHFIFDVIVEVSEMVGKSKDLHGLGFLRLRGR